MLGIRTVLGASLVFTMTALGIAACSSDDPKPPPSEEHLDYCDLPVVCQEIVDACHRKDTGVIGSEINDCHDTGHEVGTQEACEKVHDDCIQTCNDTPLPPNAEPEEPWNCSDGGHDH